MRIRIITMALALMVFNVCKAHEGMWIPTLLNAIEDELHAEGLKLSAEDIYSINQSSLKDAIVHFGGGCTAEVISEEGLILTNYHCGYSQVQSHSSVEQDYLTEGFWAKTKADELKNPGLTATFIVRIEDVSARVYDATSGAGTLEEKNLAIEKIYAELQNEATADNKYKARVVPFYYGSEHYMIVSKTYSDVRLVGAPPSSIGKFGGDTDNWIWPRHTGDFSLFRIYADSANEPADMAEGNKPYKPKKSLQISASGVSEGEFTMVYGFPGRTEKYLTSHSVDYVQNIENPAKIAMREETLAIMEQSMNSDDKIRIQYAAKQSRVSNAWKKWIGQNFGLNQQKVLDQKMMHEKEFQEKINADTQLKSKYGNTLNDLKKINEEIEPYKMSRAMFIEYIYYGPEIVRFINRFDELISNYEDYELKGTVEKEKERLMNATDGFFKNYHQPTDMLICQKITEMYVQNVKKELQPLSLRDEQARKKLSNTLYVKSLFSNKDNVKKMLKKLTAKTAKKVKNDPGFKFSEEFFTTYFTSIRPKYNELGNKFSKEMMKYVQAQRDLYPDIKFSPDANSTLRLTYGKVEGSNPRDAVIYKYYTTAKGIVDKYVPESNDFDLPQRLIDLIDAKDYGNYADENGDLRVCFTGSNHTSGGNSGSPALNDKGQLVGLNFDRSWESTMSDIMFSPELCRNIMVDIRYVLFVIDKYADAGHLIDEMDIVK
ncbi:MAG: hypothetical protein ACI8XB_000044 [Patiriisocius sp.]|jgi:hypothetical protein